MEINEIRPYFVKAMDIFTQLTGHPGVNAAHKDDNDV